MKRFFKWFIELFNKKPKLVSADVNREKKIRLSPSQLRGFAKATKKRKKKHSRRRTANRSTPINPLNRHSELGFAVRRMLKANRKAKELTAYRWPQILSE